MKNELNIRHDGIFNGFYNGKAVDCLEFSDALNKCEILHFTDGHVSPSIIPTALEMASSSLTLRELTFYNTNFKSIKNINTQTTSTLPSLIAETICKLPYINKVVLKSNCNLLPSELLNMDQIFQEHNKSRDIFYSKAALFLHATGAPETDEQKDNPFYLPKEIVCEILGADVYDCSSFGIVFEHP
jgi:hypothetical protein